MKYFLLLYFSGLSEELFPADLMSTWLHVTMVICGVLSYRSEYRPSSWESRCAIVRHPWQNDVVVWSPLEFYPWFCYQCWPNGELREPGMSCHTRESGCHYKMCVLTQVEVFSFFFYKALTCRSLPLDRQSLSFHRVSTPHRPARNPGSPLEERQRQGEHTKNDVRHRDTVTHN